MRRMIALISLLTMMALAAGFGAARRRPRPTPTARRDANGNAAGARDGTGPGGTGIGGTSDNSRHTTVGGNSDVEPTGVNKNAGATPPPNRNR